MGTVHSWSDQKERERERERERKRQRFQWGCMIRLIPKLLRTRLRPV